MIQIRKYTDSDLSDLEKLMMELQAHEKQVYSERREPTQEFAQEYISDLLKDVKENQGIIYLAEEDGAVGGFVAGYIEEDKENITDYFTVSDLVVTKNLRGKGVGIQLMNEIEKYAKSIGQTKLGLGVLVGNNGAYSLYKKLGFRDFAIEMIKDL